MTDWRENIDAVVTGVIRNIANNLCYIEITEILKAVHGEIVEGEVTDLNVKVGEIHPWRASTFAYYIPQVGYIVEMHRYVVGYHRYSYGRSWRGDIFLPPKPKTPKLDWTKLGF